MTKPIADQTEREGPLSALTEYELAEAWSMSPAALRRMRREGRGPRWTRIGRLVRYPVEWLHEFLEARAGQESAPRRTRTPQPIRGSENNLVRRVEK